MKSNEYFGSALEIQQLAAKSGNQARTTLPVAIISANQRFVLLVA